MASYGTQSDLVVQTVRDLNDLRTATYNLATTSLEDLKQAIVELPLTIIDTDIGAQIDINWTAVIPTTPTVVEPTVPDIADVSSLPTIGDVTQPAEVDVGTAPVWSVSLDTVPTAPSITWPTAPTFDELPTIDTVVPVISVEALSAAFSYIDPTYSIEIENLKQSITGVLNGNLGLPASYWEDIWQRASGTIAKVAVGKLRQSRNRGAASWWSLPSEAVLSAARQIQDETAKSLQLDRLEKAVQEAVFAREDFWKGMDAAIKYEELFLTAHQQMAARTLEAAKETVNSLIAVYNANLAGFTFILEAAKTEVEIDKITYEALTAKYQALAQMYAAQVQQSEGEIKLYASKLDGYKIEKELLIQNAAEQVKYWNGVVDADIKYKTLIQSVDDLKVKAYTADTQGFAAIYNAANSLYDLRIKGAKYPAEYAQIEASLDEAKNKIEIEKGRLITESQKAKAQLDVTQSQWIQANALENISKVAEFNYSYAQAIATVSDVSLSAGTDIGFQQTYNASMNEDLAWTNTI
jgi:hypothetical protein